MKTITLGTFIITIFLFSCSKNSDHPNTTAPPAPPPPQDTMVNFKYIHGWWKLDLTRPYAGGAELMYFGADSLYFQIPGGIYISSAQAGHWRRVGKDSMAVGLSVSGIGTNVDAQWKMDTLTNELFVAHAGMHSGRYLRLDSTPIPRRPISTVAGTGYAGFGGDGGPATSATIREAVICFDMQGNLYMADNKRIRKITPKGLITTVAGNGYGNNKNGPAMDAGINPRSLVCDKSGNLIFTDVLDNTIRKVDFTNNIVSTIAGISSPVYGSFSGDGGPATSAHFNEPTSLAIDKAGNLFFCDQTRTRIRKISASDGKITTVAGNGIQGYSADGVPAIEAALSVNNIAVDKSGNIFLTEGNNYRIRKIDAITGIITSIAGNGIKGYNGNGIPALDAKLGHIASIEIDNDGNIYIGEAHNTYRIRKISVSDNKIYTIAGTGAPWYNGDGNHATAYGLIGPISLKINPTNNSLYYSDYDLYRIRKITL